MIVVTGSESFVGRELIKQLIEEKKEVIGIDLLREKFKIMAPSSF